MTRGSSPESLTGRMRRFFLDNRDEEMTYEMLSVKFECSVVEARTVVKTLREAGVVESLHVIRHPSKGVAS